MTPISTYYGISPSHKLRGQMIHATNEEIIFLNWEKNVWWFFGKVYNDQNQSYKLQ